MEFGSFCDVRKYTVMSMLGIGSVGIQDPWLTQSLMDLQGSMMKCVETVP